MFCKTDEEIQRNAGKTYQDVTALRDPLMGLGFENDLEETPVSFEGTAQDAASFFTDKKTNYIQLETV